MKNVEFYCLDPVIKKTCPVLPANQFFPDWYKSLPLIPSNASRCPYQRLFDSAAKPIAGNTVKGCLPILDYISGGYIIPWTKQVLFQKEKQEGVAGFSYFCQQNNYISFLHANQLPILNTYFFNVVSDWTVKTPPGYSTLFFQPFYHFEKRYSMLPAIVDTDKYHSPNYIGYLIEENFTILPNEPLICAFPFKRDSYKSILKDESDKNPTHHMKNFFSLFSRNVYKRFAWTKKEYR